MALFGIPSMSSNIGQDIYRTSGLCEYSEPDSTCFKVVLESSPEKQHYFLHNSGAQPMSLYGKLCSWITTKRDCAKHPRLVSPFSSPYPYLQVPQFLKHLSSEGAIVCQWGSPKDRGWSWETSPRHMVPRGPCAKLFQPRGSTILGVKYVVSLQVGPLWSGDWVGHADSKSLSRPIVGSTFPATCSHLFLPPRPSSLENKACSASRGCDTRPGYCSLMARVSILSSFLFFFLCFIPNLNWSIYSWMTRLWGCCFFSSILDLQQLDSLTHRCTYVLSLFSSAGYYRVLNRIPVLHSGFWWLLFIILASYVRLKQLFSLTHTFFLGTIVCETDFFGKEVHLYPFLDFS